VATGVRPGRHSRHYVTQLVTFSVENCLFRVPVNALMEGKYFKEMFADRNFGDGSQGSSDASPIILDPRFRVTASDLESFLDVLLTRAISKYPDLSFKQWAAALKLASMWSFDAVKAFCIIKMDGLVPSLDPFEVINICDKCGVDKWLQNTFKRLCERDEMLNAEEGAKLGYRRLTAICRVREQRKEHSYKCDRCSVCHPSPPAAFGVFGARPQQQNTNAFGATPSFGVIVPAKLTTCQKDAAILIEKEKDLQVVGL